MPEQPPLRFLSFGAGAIGTYVGGSLALAGFQVTFVERPDSAELLRQNGLRLEIGAETRRVPAARVAVSLEDALSQGEYDLALFAIKAYDTDAVLAQLEALAGRLPVFLCLQNGVENEGKLARALGADKVLAATVTSAVGRQGVGDIRLERLRGMAVADGHELSGRVVAALNQAGLNAALLANADAIKWSKMLTNLPGNATAAILNMTPGEVYRHPGLLRLELAQLRETLAVMRALSIPVVDLPGTPVRMLAFAARSLPPLIAQPLLQRAIGKGRGEKMPSFLIDLRSGRGQSEVEYLNGAVARIGERAGVDARVNARLSEILMALARGELPVAAYDHRPDALIREIGLQKNRSGQTEER